MTTQTTPTLDGKRISIRFPYDPNLVATVKTIPGAKWDGASWTVHGGDKPGHRSAVMMASASE